MNKKKNYKTIQIIAIVVLTAVATILPSALSAQIPAHHVANMPNNMEKLLLLDSVARRQKSLDTALVYIKLMKDLAIKLNNPQFVVRASMRQAEAYNKAYDYKKSIEAYSQAINTADSLHDLENLGICYNELANNLTRTNDYNRASEYYNKALHVFFELDDTLKITDVYRNMGRQCVSFHLYETANSYFNNAFRLDSAAGKPNLLALDYYNIGKSDYSQFLDLDSLELLKRGIKHILTALRLTDKSDSNKRIVMGCYEQLMLMYTSCFNAATTPELRKEAHDSAHYYYNLTAHLRNELYPNNEHIVLEITNANFLNMDGKYNEAHRILSNLENKFDQSGSKYSRYWSFLYRSMIWVLRASGNYKEAVAYSEKFKAIEETTYNREFAVKSTKASAEAEFGELIRQREEMEREQELRQTEQTKRQRMYTIFFAIAIVFILPVGFIIWNNLKRKRKNNELLIKQKNEIQEKNKELQIQNQKIISQRDEIMSQRDEIESQRSQLSEANSRITASIRYAQRIQTAAVPSPDIMKKIFGDCMIYWSPLNIVSGDFYWATQVGHQKLITAADCTGHGVPGAFMSMLGVSTLNDIAAQKDVEDHNVTAAGILDELRDKIIAALRQSGPQRETQDGMDMVFCIIDNNKGELQYAGANRPLWIIRNGELIEYKGDRMPVGYHFRKNAPFTNTIIKIQKDDVIYMGSDGIINQFGGKEETKFKFGDKRFKEMLCNIANKPFAEQKALIEETLTEWRTKSNNTLEAQLDDQILVGIRI